jgi:transposase
MRSKGTASELEARRRIAVDKLCEGWTQVAIADFLGVHPVTVAKWVARHRQEGDAGLAAKPTPGRPRFLTPDQEQKVLGWLAEKPTAHGFRTDLWTARRVADLIRRRFGVQYHPDYLRAWLRQRGYSPQKPRRRAKQKSQPVIDQWVAGDWPRIQKKRPTRKPTSS